MIRNRSGAISLGWFVAVAVILLGGGIAGFAYLLYTGISAIGADLIPISAPGRYDVSLREAGTYTVFREFGGAEGGGPAELPGHLGLELKITGPEGEEVQVGPSSANQTYNLSGRSGVSIMQFTVNNPGEHVIEASLGNTQPGTTVTLTVIHGFLSRIFRTIAKSGGVLLAGLLGCALVVVAAVVSRKTGKKGPPPLVPPPME